MWFKCRGAAAERKEPRASGTVCLVGCVAGRPAGLIDETLSGLSRRRRRLGKVNGVKRRAAASVRTSSMNNGQPNLE